MALLFRRRADQARTLCCASRRRFRLCRFALRFEPAFAIVSARHCQGAAKSRAAHETRSRSCQRTEVSMCLLSPPFSLVEPVTDVLHGVPITDPYRWLEDQNSPETRAWIAGQTAYARAYLDHLPGRERIRERVRELLDVETYDSFLKSGSRYFFRKRLRGQEQPSLCFREGPGGQDRLLLDPSTRGTGHYTSVKPLR